MPLATRARILGCGLVRTVCSKPQVRTRRVRTTLQIGGRGIVATQEEDIRKRNRFVRMARPLAASKGRERGSEDLSRPTMRAIPSPTNPVDTVPIRRVLRPYHPTPRADQGALTNDVSTMRFVLPHRRRALRGAAVRFVSSCSIPSRPRFRSVLRFDPCRRVVERSRWDSRAETNPQTCPTVKGRSTQRIHPGCVRLQVAILPGGVDDHMPSHKLPCNTNEREDVHVRRCRKREGCGRRGKEGVVRVNDAKVCRPKREAETVACKANRR